MDIANMEKSLWTHYINKIDGKVNFIQKKLSIKSYPQICHVKNIMQMFYPNFLTPKNLFYITFIINFST